MQLLLVAQRHIQTLWAQFHSQLLVLLYRLLIRKTLMHLQRDHHSTHHCRYVGSSIQTQQVLFIILMYTIGIILCMLSRVQTFCMRTVLQVLQLAGTMRIRRW